jgi:hypothetical protein
MLSTQPYPGVEEHETARPLLGLPPMRVEVIRRAVELGVDLDGMPDDLTVRQAGRLMAEWSTPAEQAEAAALVQDLWMMIGGRARLRPPPAAQLDETVAVSALRALELRESATDFDVWLYGIVAAAWRRAEAAAQAPASGSGTL